MSESEVCTIKAFQNSKSNFLVLYEYNLILFRESTKKVYCFDFSYIEDVLHTRKNPFTGKALPLDFLKDLRYFYKELMISESEGNIYQERIKGEKDWVYTDLGWDEATKYCWSEFDSFIRGRTNPSEYTTEIEKKKGACEIYPHDFSKVALKIKNLFPNDLLKKEKWGVRWHSSYPGVELYYLGEKQPKNILPSNNIFNCQFNRPGFDYNMFCDLRSSMDRYILKFLKDPYNEENLKFFRKTKLSSLKRSGMNVWPIKKKIPETERSFGFKTSTKYKLYNPNGYEHYSVESPEIKDIDLSIKNLLSGKKITSGEDLEIYHIKTGWVQKDVDKIIKDAIIYLGQTYKIHLQPKPQYQLYTFKRVFDIINTPKLKGYVDDIKAIVPYTKVLGEKRIPSIVIYPVFGNNNAQKILNAISSDKELLEKSGEIGLNIVPRFNHTLNKLIFWASGGGSDKLELNEVGKLDEYLDGRANWAHYLCGDEQNLCHIQPQFF